jgi:hypothetical protein
METSTHRTANKFYERTADAGFRRFITEVNHNVTITKSIKSHKNGQFNPKKETKSL